MTEFKKNDTLINILKIYERYFKKVSKTIKELADEIGVSKQKVAYHVKKLDEKQYTRIDKTIYINTEGEKSIKKKLKADSSNGNNTHSTSSKVDEKYIETLKNQLLKKDEQIQVLLDNQKKEHSLIDQQQQLHQQANQRIEKLEQQLALEAPKKMKDSPTSQELELQAEKLKRKEAEIKKLKAEVEELDHANNLWYEQDQERKKQENAKKWFQFWR